MTDEPAHDHPRRVVLGATCFADAEAALGLALGLAAQTGAELRGLMIEEETIIAYAGHRRARALDLAGRSTGGLSVERMVAAFRQDTRRLEQSLAEAARKRPIRWSVTLERGRMAAVLSGAAGIGDLILIGYRPARPATGGLVLVLGEDDGRGIIGLAGRIAGATEQDMHVLVPPARRAEIAETLRQAGLHRAVVESYADAAALHKRLGRMSPAVVVMAPGAGGAEAAARLVEIARAPLILPVPAKD